MDAATRAAKHDQLDVLARVIQAEQKTCENAYYTWNAACERLRRLKRESDAIWGELFDSVSQPDT